MGIFSSPPDWQSCIPKPTENSWNNGCLVALLMDSAKSRLEWKLNVLVSAAQGQSAISEKYRTLAAISLCESWTVSPTRVYRHSNNGLYKHILYRSVLLSMEAGPYLQLGLLLRMIIRGRYFMFVVLNLLKIKWINIPRTIYVAFL